MPYTSNPLLAATSPLLAGTAKAKPVQAPGGPGWGEWLDPDKSAFGSALQWVDRPGQGVRNILSGNIGAGLRQLGDFVLEIPDAVIPGDAIPALTSPKDSISGSQMFQKWGFMPEDAPWWSEALVDLGTGMLTDPLTFLTLGGKSAATQSVQAAKKAGLLRGAAKAAKLKALGGDLVKGERLAELEQAVEETVPRFFGAPDAASILRKNLTPAGRKALRTAPEQTRLRIMEYAEKLADPDITMERARSLLRSAKIDGKRAFNTGGVQFGGAQVLEEGALAGMLPQRMRGALETAGKALERPMSRIGEVLGYKNMTMPERRILEEAQALGSAVQQPHVARAARVFGQLPPLEREAITAAFQGVVAPGGKLAQDIAPYAGPADLASKVEWALSQPQFASADRNLVRQAAEGMSALSRTEADEIVSEGWAALRPVFTRGDEVVEVKDLQREHAKYVRTLERNLRRAKTASQKAAVRARLADARSAERHLGRMAEMRRAAGLKTTARAEEARRNLSAGAARGDVLLTRSAAAGFDAAQAARQTEEAAAALKANRGFSDWAASQGYEIGSGQWGSDDYLQRVLTGRRVRDGIGDELTGQPSALASRSLRTPEELYEFLRQNDEVRMEPDAFVAALNRAQQQGRIAQRARLVKSILGEDVALNSPAAKAMDEFMAAAGELDGNFGRLLQHAYKGMPPRNWFTQALASTNRIFKPAAVYGLFIPKGLSPLTRNQLSAVFQAWAEGGRRAAGVQMREAPLNLFNAVVDMWNKASGQRNAVTKTAKELRAIDDAIRGSNTWREVGQKLEGIPGEAYRLGVLDGFVDSEEIMRDLGVTTGGRWAQKVLGAGRAKRVFDFMDMPAAGFRGLEQSMRYSHYRWLRTVENMSPDEAAREIRDTFFDYTVVSPGNRTLRDFIPFAAFTTNAIKQQGKWMVRNPAVAVGAAQLYGGDETTPKLPWIAQTPHIAAGTDSEGNPLYWTGLGLPMEALDMVPLAGDPLKLGREVRQNIIGSAHPLLKYAWSATAGRDPFFNSPHGSYDKAPVALQLLGAPERGTAGRVWNELASTGMVQPIETMFDTLDRAADTRKTLGQRALGLLTGGRLVSNDPDRAVAEQAQNLLSTSRGVRTYQTYAGGDDQAERAINALRDARRRLKEKRQEQAATE